MATSMDRLTRVPAPSDFLSDAECRELFERVLGKVRGGGFTRIAIETTWRANLRWAMNTIISAGDTRHVRVGLTRRVNGAEGRALTTKFDEDGLGDLVRRAEWALLFQEESGASIRHEHHFLPYPTPQLFYPATKALSAADRSHVARIASESTEGASLYASGYLEVDAFARALYDTDGLARYYPATTAQYSLTVRNPGGTGSGWAGLDHNDWARIDTAALSASAVEKCRSSADPRAVEPGRYTAILEPQAVHNLFGSVVASLDRSFAENFPTHPFFLKKNFSKLGLQVLDRRLSVSTDPMDPDCGYIPFDENGEPYRAATWIKDGVLTALGYDRRYAIGSFGTAVSLPLQYAYRLQGSGPTSSIPEMIASTKRGVLVTRFSGIAVLDSQSLLTTGTTRDGLWLVENGKIMHSIKNFRFIESPLFAFNAVEQIGASVRVFSPQAPAVVPAMKVRDFNFSSLADAV